jgi:hypothetical protein
MTGTITEDIKEMDESVPEPPAAQALISEPSTVETVKEEQYSEPVPSVSVPDADQHETTDSMTTESQEHSREETAGSAMQIAESSPVHDSQPTESHITPAVESVTEVNSYLQEF